MVIFKLVFNFIFTNIKPIIMCAVLRLSSRKREGRRKEERIKDETKAATFIFAFIHAIYVISCGIIAFFSKNYHFQIMK